MRSRAATSGRSATPRVRDLLAAVDAASPLRLAAEWDNVGLLLGEAAAPVRRVLLTIDLTARVLAEARAGGAHAIVSYHPPIFSPLKRLTSESPMEATLLEAARCGIAVISPHTALDAVAGGVCDWLAEGIGAGPLSPLDPAQHLPPGERVMVATKCPAAAVSRIREAMSLAGAGRIGEYTHCAFESSGFGSFQGSVLANPRVGKRGVLERAPESKLEMVVSRDRLADALSALRATHPYEEPPIEVIAMSSRPSNTEGQGRLLELLRPASEREIIRRLKRHLGVPRLVLVAGAALAQPGPSRRARPRAHRVIGLCPGSGASLVAPALARGCTLFVTGEMKHHDQLDAAARGCSLLLAGHTNTERGYLPRYARLLASRIKRVRFAISRADRHPGEAV